ncbi:MAG TPA: hypothetical protein PK331_16650 [Gordonia sp. (in: high G+C Gram-positive bacteria)]|uniref:hypothetical protein n=1 Tax=Mycobacteriales TaxID=85007 RepID=UPI002454D683|nr:MULTISPECIES: hypothetical protein [Mycobacteriales]HNP58619.1 hypothetical protein [Gordonia sp. (in: high G+C Gram-positive bacteria)]HRC52540.1 hypothetical protein [Gordonia sp. (in: high G+C Gram-positive bacteria)]
MSEKGWHRVASWYWWAILALSVVVSSYGNVRHAELIAPAEVLTEAKWIGGALPVTLLLMVEGIAFGVRSGVAGWQRTLATVIVGSLGAVVLASSYIGLLSVVELTELFAGGTWFLNLGLAAVPDLLMIASTVYVMSLRRPAEAEVSEDRQPSRWSRIAGNLLDRVESATEAHSDADDARADVVSRGSDHEAAQPVDRPAPRHAAQGEPTPVAQPVDHGSAPVAQPVDHGVIREPAQPVDQAAHPSDLREPEVIREGDEVDQVGIEPIPADLEQVIQEVIREANREWFTVSRGSDEPVDQWLSHEADHPADHEPVQEVIREANHDVDQAREPRPSREPIRPSHGSAAAEDRLAELARQTAEALGGDADEDLIRQALVLQESGLSLRKTSTELDVPYSTLRRWVARAKELAEATPRLRVISN